jgi:hypothetical protein
MESVDEWDDVKPPINDLPKIKDEEIDSKEGLAIGVKQEQEDIHCRCLSMITKSFH